MKSRTLFLAGICLILAIALFGSSSRAEVLPPPLACDQVDSTGGGTLVGASACDQVGATFWESANVPYPHWIVVNLTTSATLDGITFFTLTFGEMPSNYLFQIPVSGGGGWSTYQTFTNGASCTIPQYNTFKLNPITLSQFRILGDVSKCGGNFMAIAEILTTKGTLASNVFLTPSDWTIIFFVLLFLLLLWIGLGSEISVRGSIFVLLAGLTALFLGLQIWGITANVPLAILFLGTATVILIYGMGMAANAAQQED